MVDWAEQIRHPKSDLWVRSSAEAKTYLDSIGAEQSLTEIREQILKDYFLNSFQTPPTSDQWQVGYQLVKNSESTHRYTSYRTKMHDATLDGYPITEEVVTSRTYFSSTALGVAVDFTRLRPESVIVYDRSMSGDLSDLRSQAHFFRSIRVDRHTKERVRLALAAALGDMQVRRLR